MRAQRLACVIAARLRADQRPPQPLGLRPRRAAHAHLPRHGRGRHQPARPVGGGEHGRDPGPHARAPRHQRQGDHGQPAHAAEGDRDGARRRPAADGAASADEAAALHRARHDRLHRAGRRLGGLLEPRRRGQARRRAPGWRRRRPPSGSPAEPRRGDELRRSAAARHDAARAAALRAVLRAAARARASSWCASAGATCTASCAARRWSPPARAERAATTASAWSARSCSRTPPTAPRTRCSSRARPTRLPGFGFANNLRAAARPGELSRPAVGAGHRLDARRAWFDDGTPVPIDTRRVLQRGAGAPRRRRLRPDAAASRSSSTSTASPTTRDRVARPGARRLAGRAAGDDDDPSRLQPARRRLGRPGRRAAGASSSAPAQGLGLPLRSLEIELGPEPGRGGVRRRPMRSPPPTRWCCSATACARRCAAPATTPASSAGRRSRT